MQSIHTILTRLYREAADVNPYERKPVTSEKNNLPTPLTSISNGVNVVPVNQTVLVICKGCGKEFEPVREWQKYCTEPCSARQRYLRYRANVKKALKLLRKQKSQRRTA